MKPAALFACLAAPLCLATPALAQSSLGFTQGEARVGAVSVDGETRANASLSIDFAITGHHGLQFDLGLADQATGALGSIDGHLYMVPGRGWKYGLFGHVSDLDGIDATTLALGAEAMVDLGPATRAEAKAGIGVRNPGSFDCIFAQGALDHALSDRVGIYAAAMVADYDEPGFSATGYEARIGARWHLASAPVVIDASIGRSGLWGEDSLKAETVARLSVSLTLGADRSARAPVDRRMFRPVAPLAPLQLRGLE